MISRIPSVPSIVSTLPYASLRYAALYRVIRATLRFLPLSRATPHFSALHCAPTTRCATLRPSTTLRYTALLNNMLRYAAPRYAYLCYTALRCTTPHYTALLRAIQGYPTLFSTLFYSINCKVTTGRMDVKPDEGCEDPATNSK